MVKNERNKGITLIALIVTIVVLLILAGVTINAITSSENTMEKATEAREKDKQGTELETIKLAVVNSVASDLTGLVNADNLKEGLNGLVEDEGRLRINKDNSPWIVTGKTGMKYKINQNGEVTSAEPVASVEFNSITASIEVGKTKKLTIITKGKSGSETEANEFLFTSSNTNVATVESDGSIKINSNATEGATAVITVNADGIDGLNECLVTAIKFPEIGDYIEYNVAYRDMYRTSNVNLTTTNGWRILETGTYNEETGKYDGIKIISTGAPAELNYKWNQENDNTWWDTTKTGVANQAAAGLASEIKFLNIKFDGDGSDTEAGWNKGRRYSETSIINSDHLDSNNNNITNYSDDGCGIFLTTKANGVHNLTLEELNTAINKMNAKVVGDDGYRDVESKNNVDVDGIFSLRGYRFTYWIAASYERDVWLAYVMNTSRYEGKISSNGGGNYGLRPVVTLKSVTLKKNGTYWQVDPQN